QWGPGETVSFPSSHRWTNGCRANGFQREDILLALDDVHLGLGPRGQVLDPVERGPSGVPGLPELLVGGAVYGAAIAVLVGTPAGLVVEVGAGEVQRFEDVVC